MKTTKTRPPRRARRVDTRYAVPALDKGLDLPRLLQENEDVLRVLAHVMAEPALASVRDRVGPEFVAGLRASVPWADAIAALDIGQTIAVKHRAVVAVVETALPPDTTSG